MVARGRRGRRPYRPARDGGRRTLDVDAALERAEATVDTFRTVDAIASLALPWPPVGPDDPIRGELERLAKRLGVEHLAAQIAAEARDAVFARWAELVYGPSGATPVRVPEVQAVVATAVADAAVAAFLGDFLPTRSFRRLQAPLDSIVDAANQQALQSSAVADPKNPSIKAGARRRILFLGGVLIGG